MKKYKIIQSTNDNREGCFYILQKKWRGWKEISTRVGENIHELSFLSYEKCEEYLYKEFGNYHGDHIKDGNIYSFTPLSVYY